jgi:hypothetical protein
LILLPVLGLIRWVGVVDGTEKFAGRVKKIWAVWVGVFAGFAVFF